MHRLRFRQVHLDFHTSEQIPGVGSEFDADEWVSTLKRAHVDSVTLFSRCHHGMIYHDTRFPARHPHLTCNLLAEQIAACHRNDIRCPIYTSVGLDEFMARQHPDWIEVGEDGRRAAPGPLEARWSKHCFASPIVDYVIEQTQEVLDIFGDEVDGLFFDIIGQGWVHSKWCMDEYARLGMDPADPKCQDALRRILVNRYKERMTAAVRAKNPHCAIFHNSGHIFPDWRPVLHTYTHIELESLPSGGWGYAHFPITQRYARRLGLDCLGMTGRFADSWGHFGSYKPQAALDYECFNSLALGAKCSIGDQCPPSGRLDAASFDMIGRAYAQVEEREPWCVDAEPLVDIAVFNVEATGRAHGQIDPAALGAYRMLLEGHHQFDFVDWDCNWSPYAVVVLPDKVLVDAEAATKIDAYLAAGGSLICSHESGLAAVDGDFAIAGFPARRLGDLPYLPDYLAPLGTLADRIEPQNFVMYLRGLRVAAAQGAERLADIWEPYFQRRFDHFCSHAQTPPAARGDDPGVLHKGRIVYFAHPVFATYATHSMVHYRTIVLNMLRDLLPEPLVRTDGPTTLHVTVNRQPALNRTVIHLLHYIPERRMLGPNIVEEALPIYNVGLDLRAERPSRAYLAPGGTDVPFEAGAGRVRLTVPEVRGHVMAVLEDGRSL